MCVCVLCVLCVLCVFCVCCVCSVCVVCVCLRARVIVVNIVPVGASVPLAERKGQPSRQLGSLTVSIAGSVDMLMSIHLYLLLSGIFLYSHCSLLLFAGI